MKNSWEKQQDGVIFKKIGIWDTLMSVCDFAMKKYNSEPITDQLFLQEELW